MLLLLAFFVYDDDGDDFNFHIFRSNSPFWRPPRDGTSKRTGPGRDANLVVGAAYSHADMLKFDNLYVYPHTPKKHELLIALLY